MSVTLRNGTATKDEAPYHIQAASEGASILARLRRRFWSFLLGLSATGALIAGLFFILPKTYLATAAVAITLPDPVVGNMPTLSEKMGDDADVESQLLMLRSPTLLGSVLARPDVAAAVRAECEAAPQSSPIGWVKFKLAGLIGASPSCEDRLATVSKALDWLDANLKIGIAGRSRVVDVSYASILPETAATVVNAIANVFVDYKTAQKSESRGVAVAWLRSEIDRRAQALHAGEQAVAEYRQQHGLARGELAPISSEQLSSLSRLLAAAEGNRAVAAAQLQQLQSGSGKLQDAQETRAALDSHTISELRFKRATVLGQIARLTSTWKGSSGIVDQLQSEQAMLGAQIQEEIARLAANFYHEYLTFDAQVTSLNHQLESVKADVGQASGAEAAIAGMVRQNDVERSIYVDLTRKANELETERRVLTGDVQLVNLADIPYKIWFPRPILFLAGGGILSIGVGCAIALLRDRRDNSLRLTSSLRADLGIQVLAHIPESKELARHGFGGVRRDGQLALWEAVRSLYAQCLLMSRRDSPKTILVTSSVPGEGKSLVTLALAGFAAAAGRRVLLIEGDLRRPSVANVLSLPVQPGLVDFLRGGSPLQDVVRSGVQGNLDVIVAGQPTLSSTELLCSSRMDELLAIAQRQYDLVIVDTPPTLMLMDARVLASRVDGVLYCARWGSSQTPAVQDGIAGIINAGGHMLGMVVNRVRLNEYPLYENVHGLETQPYIQMERT